MIPQGSEIINSEYFASLTARINAASSCADLQAATNDAMQSLSSLKGAINDQLALFEPLMSLLTAPSANPGAIVSWLTTFIESFLTPYVKPYAIYAAQLTELSTQVASLVSAIEAKQSQFSSCSVTIPSF